MVARVTLGVIHVAQLLAAAAAALVALAPGAPRAAGATAYVPAQVAARERLEAASARPLRLAVERGMPRSVALDLPAAGATPVEQARAFLQSYGPLFHLDRQEIAVTASRVLRPAPGLAVVRHAQTWRGLRVYGAFVDVLVATPAGATARVGYAQASLLNPVIVDADPPVLLSIDTTPTLTGTDAELVAYAARGCAAEDGPDPRLEIVDPQVLGLEDAPRLAWHVARPRCAGDEAFVDAATGEVLLRNGFARAGDDWEEDFFLDLEDANGGTMNATGCFNPTNMDDWIGDVSGILVEYLPEAMHEAPPANWDPSVAWHGARATYQTWHDLYGWPSFDGDDSELEVYVWSGVVANAYGLASCGIEMSPGFAGIDTVAHEFGHMVMQSHSGYYKWYEPGALHEGLCDASAMVVDPDDWTMGEDRTGGGGPSRHLDDPSRWHCGPHGEYGPCPDRYGMFLSLPEAVDDGGIHYNAGIIGKAFYLLAEGGTFNGWTVNKLADRARMGYVATLVMRIIGDTARFSDARNLAVALATPPNDAVLGFTPQEACSIRNAFRAVEIGYGDADCDGIEEEGIDTDGDGVRDFYDNCVYWKNPDQADMDQDGIGDRCDTDGDNDGYPDSVDPCWNIPNDFRDPDGDGIANCMDDDDDGDGVPEDADGIANGWNPCASGQTVGCDDNCPGDPNPDQYDGNANGFGDACDPDYDGDGIYDEDNCPFVANPDQANADGDFYGDACDGCPNDADPTAGYYAPQCFELPDGLHCSAPRPMQPDSDGDGVPDLCDVRRRGAGVLIDGMFARADRALVSSDGARRVQVSAALGALAVAPLRLCAALGDCELESERLVEVVLSGLDLSASAWVEDASGVPLARMAPSSSGDGTRGLRFRAAADGEYRLVVAPPAGLAGELDFTATVRTVAASSPSPWRRARLADAIPPALPPDADGDGLWDTIDLCPYVSEPTNGDGDADRVGDVCDGCPATTAGAVVDPAGCSIADRCPGAPLASVSSVEAWKNHGEYVACVAHEAERFVALGLLTSAAKDAVVSAAGASACGRR